MSGGHGSELTAANEPMRRRRGTAPITVSVEGKPCEDATLLFWHLVGDLAADVLLDGDALSKTRPSATREILAS